MLGEPSGCCVKCPRCVENGLEPHGQRRERLGLRQDLSLAHVWEAAGTWRELYTHELWADATCRL